MYFSTMEWSYVMKSLLTALLLIASSLVLFGCQGLERGCSSGLATSFGADWVIAQYDMNGLPYRCWMLENTSIDNEPASDGIYWKSPDGSLVHISGTYNRVQVKGGKWDQALAEIGLSKASCDGLNKRVFDVASDQYIVR